MSTVRRRGPSGNGHALQQRLLIAGLAVLVAALGIQAMLKPSEFIDVYVRAGAQLFKGEDFYAPGFAYLYPPFAALAAAPFALIPEWLARAIWFAVNIVAATVMIFGAWRLAGGPSRWDFSPAARGEWIAISVGLACSISFVLNAFAHQQTDILIGALIIGGATVLRSGRDACGGALLGLAASFKATPLLWAPYLALRGRWLAAVLVGALAVALNLLPDLVNSPPGGGIWLADWATRFVLPTQDFNAVLGLWGSDLIYNQALGGTVQRIVNTVPHLFKANPTVDIRPLVASTTLKLIVYAIFAALIAVSIAVARRRTDPLPAGAPDREVFEYSIVLILMLLMSPMSGRAHFGILVLPAFCLTRTALVTKSRFLWGLTVAAALLAIFGNKDLVGTHLHFILLWVGSTTVVTLMLWVGCVYGLARQFKAPGRPAP